MPSISGIESKIRDVISCGRADMTTATGERLATIYEAITPMGEISNSIIRFISDMETREQAERRIINDCISNLNHSSCDSCMALCAAL